MSIVGRFAPSPTGMLHLGNLRTAVAAQVLAGPMSRFIIRMEDLDRMTSRRDIATKQLADLAAVGVRSDVPIVYQSERFDIYLDHLDHLRKMGMTYECFCTRREIREAASAPHSWAVRYPGTCRDLSERERARLSIERQPATRLRALREAGDPNVIDDVVLLRNDGVPAYNLAVVVDDELQGVTQVVRGIDLEPVTPSQRYLGSLLGFRPLEYVHVGLVVGPDGERLAKRHGAVTLGDWIAAGGTASGLRRALEATLEGRETGSECPIEDIFQWA